MKSQTTSPTHLLSLRGELSFTPWEFDGGGGGGENEQSAEESEERGPQKEVNSGLAKLARARERLRRRTDGRVDRPSASLAHLGPGARAI